MAAIIWWGLTASSWLMLANPELPLWPLAEEICDNGRDDDGDGFIDLQDVDCDCPIVQPQSLIPNPSFEDRKCCPQARSELNCAETWIQASVATTDYLHTCGWMGWENLPPPRPIPHGEGFVGFRDGRFGNVKQANWKEYAGACLLAPMKAFTAYRLRFNIGFTHAINSPPTNVVIFGATDCKALPFGENDANFGCPTNGPGWVRLGAVNVSGTREWIETEINFVPKDNIYAIAIGPDCQAADSETDLYYFLDNLILDQTRNFEFRIAGFGNPCSSSFTLEAPLLSQVDYQWYKDGVALVGQTAQRLTLKTGPGSYQVRLTGPNECLLSLPFNFAPPVRQHQVQQRLCGNQPYRFNGQALTRPGLYRDTLKDGGGCDSIVTLELLPSTDLLDTVAAQIIAGQRFEWQGRNFSQPGQYRLTLASRSGCDSTVLLNLSAFQAYFPNVFSPNGDGSNDRFNAMTGPAIQQVLSLKIFDRWGGLVYSGVNLSPHDTGAGWDGRRGETPLPEGLYLFLATLALNDGVAHQLQGSVLLVR